MTISFSLAKGMAGITAGALRIFGRTGGALPGKVAVSIDPDILAELAANITESSILVVATNGKTTVTNLLANILEADGHTVVCNRGGANMPQGIASVLLRNAPAEWGVFETDELYLGTILSQLRSRYVLLMDIFPDQLDRMGGTGRLVRSIASALASCPQTILVYNADDPNCREVARTIPNPTVSIGTAQRFSDNATLLASDTVVQTCPHCSSPLFYAWRQYGPLGDYLCPSCGFARGREKTLDAVIRDGVVGADECSWTVNFQSDVFAQTAENAESAESGEGVEGAEGAEGVENAESAEGVENAEAAETAFAPDTSPSPSPAQDDASWQLSAPYGASYMVYNLTFAATMARMLGVPGAVVQRAIDTFEPQNGRLETLTVNGHTTLINLAKNPVGFDQNIRLICKHDEPCVVGFFVNNNVGDGVDASWVAKVNFDALAERVRSGNMRVFVGGMCKDDLLRALRKRSVPVTAVEDAREVLVAAAALPSGGRVYLIANYSALSLVKVAAESAAQVHTDAPAQR